MKLIIATCPTDHAKGLGQMLIETKLAACVNIIPSISSVYSWNEAVVEDTESLLLIKTSAPLVKMVSEAFHSAHPYDVPEFIVVDVDQDASSKAYLAWVNHVTQRSPSA
jgi:periplasmic divalent cation tolerance protein